MRRTDVTGVNALVIYYTCPKCGKIIEIEL